MKFTDFNFQPQLLEGLDAMGFETATPVQEQAIPIILEGSDLIACAQTGTGKTAAFLLPLLNNLVGKQSDTIDTIIISPTRELAIQIDRALEGFAYFTNTSSLPVYGGGSGDDFVKQKQALKSGADIIVATPGKLLSHLNLGYVSVDGLRHLVLDEADRMLDMGFFEDIMKIISFLPEKRQTLMFSATMPPKIRDMAKKVLKDPKQINIALSKPAAGIKQGAYMVYDEQKVGLITHVLNDNDYPSVIIFSSTIANVKAVERTLSRLKFPVAAIHSDLDQKQREAVLNNFRNKTFRILVATDILSRGIDIEGIGLIVNFDVPHDAEDYIHRIGRTARAESKGEAITFINPREQRKFHKIEQLIEKEIPKLPLPEALGRGPVYDPTKRPPDSDRHSRGRSGPGGRRGGSGKSFKPHGKGRGGRK